MEPKLPKPLRLIANALLGVAERGLSSGRRLHCPPVFIVGVPRSGTTVTRQMIASTLRTSYFSNFGDRLLRYLGVPYPAISAVVLRCAGDRPVPITYTSNYGKTPGRRSPAESEFTWAYWFQDRYGEVAPSNVLPHMKRAMYRGVAATERLSGKPFVNKTTVLSLRIDTLAEVFPGALFIHVKRDPIDVAQSLLVARRGRFPDWLGPRPKECDDVPHDDVVGQVCAQVRFTHERIMAYQRRAGSDRFLTIFYRQLCADPPQELERIKQFLLKFDVPVSVAGIAPKSLPFAHGKRDEVPGADYDRLEAYFQEHPYIGPHGHLTAIDGVSFHNSSIQPANGQ